VGCYNIWLTIRPVRQLLDQVEPVDALPAAAPVLAAGE